MHDNLYYAPASRSKNILISVYGAIQVLRNAVGVGVYFPGKKRYEGVRFNVIYVTRGWVGIHFFGKKHYVTLKCLLKREIRMLRFSLGRQDYE